MEVLGFLHIVVEQIIANDTNEPISAEISLGDVSKVYTTFKNSGEIWNEAFMFQITKQTSRLSAVCKNNQERSIAYCRYDLIPFFDHPGSINTLESQLYDDENQPKGSIKLKITFYSSEHGKLKIRVFHLSLIEPFVQKFKEAKLKICFGNHCQSTRIKSLSQEWDQTLQLQILLPTMNLSFDVINQQGILACYTINNAQKSNLLIEEIKAYQVSLFNRNKAVGTIKYQIQRIK